MALLKKRDKPPLVPARWKTVGVGGSSRRPHQMEKPPPCGAHCPIGNDMRGAMGIVARREKHGLSERQALDEAWRILTATTPFPAVLGRVCPHPCEQHCNRNEKDESVAIAAFERFVGDWGIERGLELQRLPGAAPRGKAVAIVGAGPGGLSCAYQLARRGHAVTIYEDHPQPGGMLRYGVPSYRLSRAALDAEIERLLAFGINLRCNTQVGREVSLDELRRSADALFVAIGAHRGRRLEVAGEQGGDVFSGVEFLRLANSESPLVVQGGVVVVGDGETAIDAARVANRLGRASNGNGLSVTLVRAHAQGEQDLHSLAQEGIDIVYESTPVAVERDAAGGITAVKTQRARLGSPGAGGLRVPVALGGETADLPASLLIAAVSQVPDWEGLGLLHGAGHVEVDEWGRTGLENVWSGGDSVMLGIVAESVGHGLRAAQSIHASLTGTALPERERRQPVSTGRVKLSLYEPKIRSSRHQLTPQESLHNLSAEIDQGITQQQVSYEVGRCLGCGACIGCERCWMYCTPGCFARKNDPPPGGPYFSLALPMCDGCNKCADECPSGFIEMH